MTEEYIVSSQNPRFKAWRALADSAATRHEAGQTLLDGQHLIEAFIDAGGAPRQIFLAEDSEQSYWRSRCPGAGLVLMTPRLLAALSPVKTPTGVMALIDVPTWTAAPTPHFALLLECIQDPGNLGAMLRSAAAAGVDTVFLSAGCADAWSGKVLRAGMGAHFVLRIVDDADLLQVARAWSGTLVATVLGAPQSLYDTDLSGDVAFVLGNEGAGLSTALRAAITEAVHIPMPGRMESLNVAAALAVCLFERVRRKRVK